MAEGVIKMGATEMGFPHTDSQTHLCEEKCNVKQLVLISFN